MIYFVAYLKHGDKKQYLTNLSEDFNQCLNLAAFKQEISLKYFITARIFIYASMF